MGLNIISMAGLENDLNHTIRLIFLQHFLYVAHPAVIGAHDRAVNVQIFFRQCIVNRHGLVHWLHLFPGSVAAVKADYIRAQFFHSLDDFIPNTAVGAAGDNDSGPFIGFPLKILFPVLIDLFRPCFNNGAAVFDVKIKAQAV